MPSLSARQSSRLPANQPPTSRELSENMVLPADTTPLEPPRVYLVHMLVFTLAVSILIVVLLPGLTSAFMANVGLNAVIIATLLLGIFHSYRMVGRLFPEVNWVNRFRVSEIGIENVRVPKLLGPMSNLLGSRQNTVLSPQSMRSLLDSLASRLDESRDLSRYLVGLLIFLGLLGTFWGLLETVTSLGSAIGSLDVASGQSASVFEGLKEGLKGPLAGMGLSFSSSLFGLAGSLILGFLDLKAAQAQNRFYHDLEDWLSTITDIGAGDSGHQANVQQLLRLDIQSLQRSFETLSKAMASPRPAGPQEKSVEDLAEAVASLVEEMRDEQKTMRSHNAEIQRLLSGGAAPPATLRAARARADKE